MSLNPRRTLQIGATVTMGIGKPCYRVMEASPTDQCGKCDCPDCRNINCDAKQRPDGKNIVLKKVER